MFFDSGSVLSFSIDFFERETECRIAPYVSLKFFFRLDLLHPHYTLFFFFGPEDRIQGLALAKQALYH